MRNHWTLYNDKLAFSMLNSRATYSLVNMVSLGEPASLYLMQYPVIDKLMYQRKCFFNNDSPFDFAKCIAL